MRDWLTPVGAALYVASEHQSIITAAVSTTATKYSSSRLVHSEAVRHRRSPTQKHVRLDADASLAYVSNTSFARPAGFIKTIMDPKIVEVQVA